MRQLVAGLAALHPAWKLTDDGFENRDRHHQAVRRRLRALAEMGSRKLLAVLTVLGAELSVVESGLSGTLDELRRERGAA